MLGLEPRYIHYHEVPSIRRPPRPPELTVPFSIQTHRAFIHRLQLPSTTASTSDHTASLSRRPQLLGISHSQESKCRARLPPHRVSKFHRDDDACHHALQSLTCSPNVTVKTSTSGPSGPSGSKGSATSRPSGVSPALSTYLSSSQYERPWNASTAAASYTSSGVS